MTREFSEAKVKKFFANHLEFRPIFSRDHTMIRFATTRIKNLHAISFSTVPAVAFRRRDEMPYSCIYNEHH